MDASELRRVCTIALATMTYLASATDQDAKAMALLVGRNGMGRLAADYHDALASLLSAAGPEATAGSLEALDAEVAHAAWREGEAVRSARAYASAPEALAEIGRLAASIERLAASLKAEAAARVAPARPARAAARRAPAPIDPMSQVIPVRSPDFICPLDSSYMDEKLGAEASRQVRLKGDEPYEALNFVDGKRSVADIARAVTAGLSPVSAADVLAYFELLEEAGLVSLTEGGRRGAQGGQR